MKCSKYVTIGNSSFCPVHVKSFQHRWYNLEVQTQMNYVPVFSDGTDINNLHFCLRYFMYFHFELCYSINTLSGNECVDKVNWKYN